MPSSPPERLHLRPDTVAALDRLLAERQTTTRTPSLVAAVQRDGRLAWTGQAGADDDLGAPERVAFRIGSITKTFTAVLVLRLLDEGRLGLNDRLDVFVPGTAFGDRTLAQLLSHDGGVTSEAGDPWWERVAGRSWEALLAEVAARPTSVIGDAGRRFHYSNLGFAALGRVVGVSRGTSWFEAVRAELLEPLGMTGTSFHPVAPHADGYAVHPYADVLHREPHTDTAAMAPAGQLWSTLADLAVWAQILRSGQAADHRLLAAETVTQMREWRTIARDRLAGTGREGYGLGLRLHADGDRLLIGHHGSMPGFTSGLVIDAATGDAGISLGNSTAGYGDLAGDLLTELQRLEPAPPPAWRALPPGTVPADLLGCLGVWFWGPRPHALRLVGADTLELGPADGAAGRGARFVRDPSGRWRGLDGYYAGEELTLPEPPGDAAGAVLRIATFVFTRSPYDPAADLPGGPGDGWR
jgi:CubicO group peptidase (beta-lactamase class C family)